MYVYITTVQNAPVNRGETSQHFEWHFHTVIVPETVCVSMGPSLFQGGVGFVSERPVSCVCGVQRGEEELRSAGLRLSSIPPVTRATPLREGKWVYGRAETCEVWTWIGGKPRQKEEKKGMKRMTGDKQGWARGKRRGRMDNEERQRWREGWQVIVAVGVTGSSR